MATFKVITEPSIKTEIVRDKDKKEIGIKKYVYYAISFDEPFEGKLSHYRKENGLKNYDISLVRGDEDDQRRNEQLLLKKINKDLAEGIDPKYKFAHTVAAEKAKIEEAKKVEESKVSLDDAIKLLKESKGYSGVRIAKGKEITATHYLSLYKNNFRRFLQLIGKEKDIRAVTKSDIKYWIDIHFNYTGEHVRKDGKPMFGEWSSKSCLSGKASVSSMFSVLVDKDIIAVNPCFGVKVKSDSEKNILDEEDEVKDVFELWTQEEMDIFFSDSDDINRLYFSNIGKCIFYSAIRKSELFRVTMNMVDFENECFSIPAKFTKSARKYKNANELINLDIPDSLLPALKKWVNVRYPAGYNGENFLFPHKLKTWLPTDYYTFNTHWNTFRGNLRREYGGLFMKNIYALKHNGLSAYFHALIKRKDLTPAEVILKMQTQARHSSFSETENYLRNHNLLFKEKREKANF
jgi:integrase